MSSPSENIRVARLRAGVEPAEVARSAGLNTPWYFDVEGHDDEVTGNISLGALKAIARSLATTPLELLEGPGMVGSLTYRSAASLMDLVKARIDAEHLSVDAYGSRIGWDLTSVLAEPERLWEFPFEMLRALCGDLDVDWREVLDAPRSPG
jgi:hypothetical protein